MLFIKLDSAVAILLSLLEWLINIFINNQPFKELAYYLIIIQQKFLNVYTRCYNYILDQIIKHISDCFRR